MDVGYSIHQISGARVGDVSVNQHRNVGGACVGFCADIESCYGKGVMVTTPTRSSLEQVSDDIDRWILRLNKATVSHP